MKTHGLAYHDEMLDNYAILKHQTNITADTISTIFENFLIDEIPEGVAIEELYQNDYQKPFALYSIEKDNPIHHMRPYQILGYSYGTHYNRDNEYDPLLPKEFFINIENKIINLSFYNDNVIISFPNIKDTGRDSYYLSHHQYITQDTGLETLSKIIKDKNIYLGKRQIFPDLIDILKKNIHDAKDEDIIFITNRFTEITGFNSNYAYTPYQQIELSDVLEQTEHLHMLWQEYNKTYKTDRNNFENLLSLWNEGGNMLPVSP